MMFTKMQTKLNIDQDDPQIISLYLDLKVFHRNRSTNGTNFICWIILVDCCCTNVNRKSTMRTAIRYRFYVHSVWSHSSFETAAMRLI